jgi:hypothetical protein
MGDQRNRAGHTRILLELVHDRGDQEDRDLIGEPHTGALSKKMTKEEDRRQRQRERDRASEHHDAPMTEREVQEEAKRRREEERRRRQEARAQALQHDNENSVLTFLQWCGLNNFSEATGRRIGKAGEGPPITQLSTRRVGITVRNNRIWQESRARTVAA